MIKEITAVGKDIIEAKEMPEPRLVQANLTTYSSKLLTAVQRAFLVFSPALQR